jgi:hypothetical protein
MLIGGHQDGRLCLRSAKCCEDVMENKVIVQETAELGDIFHFSFKAFLKFNGTGV